MKIRLIKIDRFRGIRELEWRVGGSFVCLVGPGDSTKTTILDAVEFALSPGGTSRSMIRTSMAQMRQSTKGCAHD